MSSQDDSSETVSNHGDEHGHTIVNDGTYTEVDVSNSEICACEEDFLVPEIVRHEQHITETTDAYTTSLDVGFDAGENVVIHSTFDTIDASNNDPDIHLNLVDLEEIYDDSENSHVLDSIKLYASRIQCSDFHGKGTIDDYSELFRAASKIANESKQIQLDIDVAGFEEFGAAAEELSQLFTNFTLKLQNVNIINDIAFLRSIASALEKIWNLSETFGRFKETILMTTKIKVPKSAHETRVVLDSVMGEVTCAMNYISHFVNPDPNVCLEGAGLSSEEEQIISKAVDTIESWNNLCEQGLSATMSNDTDIQSIRGFNQDMKNKTISLRSATVTLRNKINMYKFC